MGMDKQQLPQISVCVASYNGERYIRQQIESILAQISVSDEIIVSDDASSDNTVSILKKFDDPRIVIIQNSQNMGALRNFESAIAASTKDVIVLSDQDDIWLENKMEVIRGNFLDPGIRIKMIMTDGELVTGNGNVMADTVFSMLKPSRGILRNIYRNTYMGCCMAFSSGMKDVILPFPRKIPMHDSWIGILSEIFGQAVLIEERTIRHRIHEDNLSLRKKTIWSKVRERFFLALFLLKRCVKIKWTVR